MEQTSRVVADVARVADAPAVSPRRWALPPWTASVFVVVALVALVEAVARLGLVSRTILAAPSAVADVALRLALRGEVWPHAARTIAEFGLSLAIGLAIGLASGIVFWRVPALARASQPWLVGLYAMPFIVLYPLLLVMLGLGPWPIIAISALMASIPMTLNTWLALSNVPEVYFKVAAVAGCPRLTQFTKVLLPGAAPLLFAGLKLATVYAFIGVISVEFMTAEAGLGFAIGYYYELFQAATMWGYMLWVLLLALVLSAAILWAERRLRAEL
jgi:NitT/TauT family transport system permease protein